MSPISPDELISKALRAFASGNKAEAVEFASNATMRVFDEYQKGLLDIADAIKRHQKIVGVFRQLADGRYNEQLGLACWTLATLVESLDVVGKDLYCEYRQLVGIGVDRGRAPCERSPRRRKWRPGLRHWPLLQG